MPEPEWPTRATDSLPRIVRDKLSRIFLFLEGYLKVTFLKTIVPFAILFSFSERFVITRGSIYDLSSMIPKTFLAEFLALLIDGI